jgi:hypothetical protein
MVSIREAAAVAGTTAAEIRRIVGEGRLIGVPSTRGLRLPVWQFEPNVLPSIKPVAAALGTSEPWAMLGFLETSNGGLGGRTPRAALEQGDLVLVLAIASSDEY